MNFKNLALSALEIASYVSIKNPIAGLIIRGIKAIVKKSGDGISNDSVIEVTKEMAKSKWNDLDETKTAQIIEIISGVPYERRK